jgi:lysophospholipase L1-like esterase
LNVEITTASTPSTFNFQLLKPENMPYTYLALGDSYTIGEGVPLFESFPYQAVQLLRKAGRDFHAPEIIAKTGWTTDELMAGIAATQTRETYDVVSLLIGVNNQYRCRSVQEYASEFGELLKDAIRFAGNSPAKVIVLSIPDWGITPFASGRDTKAIAKEIDAYNAVNKKIAQQYKTHYIDITQSTRNAQGDETMLAADKLHPSGKEYAIWSREMMRFL